jgi:transposase
MPFISANNRHQLSVSSLNDFVDSENVVRFFDAYVNSLDLAELDFKLAQDSVEGRPAFESSFFLKLYLYGYFNGIRSSRRLEKECHRNVEVHWLLGNLRPNYHSIADFRKVNPLAFKKVFTSCVLFLQDLELIGGKVIAVDGTKIRASNSKKNNYNPKKIERQLAYIETKTAEYLTELDTNDAKEKPENVRKIQEKIERLKTNKTKYEGFAKILDESDEPQVSTTDPDSRALLVQGQVVEVCYNTQAAVDQKHKLVVATHTINRNDRNALSAIALEAKQMLPSSQEITVLADKGYHSGPELRKTQQAGITTLVATPEVVNSNEGGTQPEYMYTHFSYDNQADTYLCPEGNVMHTTGTWHKKSSRNITHLFKKYRTPACKTCPVHHLCTGRADGRREIERSEYADFVEKNAHNYKTNPKLYRERQEINEHIFGTIKRQWGYNHTNLRGLEKVNGEIALIMTVYNLKRALNLLGIQHLIAKLPIRK